MHVLGSCPKGPDQTDIDGIMIKMFTIYESTMSPYGTVTESIWGGLLNAIAFFFRSSL